MTRVLTELVSYVPPKISVREGTVFGAQYKDLLGEMRDYIGRVISVGKFSFLAQVILESPPTRKSDRRNYVKRFWFSRIIEYASYDLTESK